MGGNNIHGLIHCKELGNDEVFFVNCHVPSPWLIQPQWTKCSASVFQVFVNLDTPYPRICSNDELIFDQYCLYTSVLLSNVLNITTFINFCYKFYVVDFMKI